MSTLDELKAARDGHLRYGPKPRLRPVVTVTRDPLTGHTFRTVEGMGEVEYAPKGCACPECLQRRQWTK
jgi:hypothetical protein